MSSTKLYSVTVSKECCKIYTSQYALLGKIVIVAIYFNIIANSKMNGYSEASNASGVCH